ncbi:MAG: hypothetical protein DWQ31_08460 [Planctomycetota bacterium]|nr:MAG: hypothetical protein DWQ31_08460 [Planctomycetota bacterium]REJ86971.1 MAG: hypothetical protein DWQ35_22710 [Planctomycetota bacterium]REK24902.1 MAG: hypothetical protein DWQ42_12460 [Planctomycetota bacterium]REK48491.1 MAG: hypothetical protein DWQ46_01990 [Planctomycetota bacterium]
MSKTRLALEDVPAAARAEMLRGTSPRGDEKTADDLAWQEALMLWLSWNRAYERLTAKMCRAGQDQEKLEQLMDEMDQLRVQAIDRSEALLRAG